MITVRSTAVDAQSPHRGTGPFSTATNHNTAAAAYTPRITAYNSGSQWSTSQIHTNTAISPIKQYVVAQQVRIAKHRHPAGRRL